MPRNRIIYQSEALFSSPYILTAGDTTGDIASGNVTNLQRVTEISNNTEVTRGDANVFGRLASISREIIEEPAVSMDFSYYLADGFNESGVGLTTYRSAGNQMINCLSGILSNDLDTQKNFYVLTVEEGMDANGVNPQDASLAGKLGIIGIGNAFLANYTAEASVGEIPTASVSVEASNITFSLSSENGIQNPAINVKEDIPTQFEGDVALPVASTGELSVRVLRPGDIQIDFGTGSLAAGGPVLPGMTSADTKQSAHIQSFSLELPLSRTPQRRLGNSFSFSREVDVPVEVTLNVTANLADLDEGSLANLMCDAEQERDITIKMYSRCGDEDADLSLVYELRGATLDTEGMDSNIGDSKTVDLTFVAQVGGPNDAEKGLFISGKHSA